MPRWGRDLFQNRLSEILLTFKCSLMPTPSDVRPESGQIVEHRANNGQHTANLRTWRQTEIDTAALS